MELNVQDVGIDELERIVHNAKKQNNEREKIKRKTIMWKAENNPQCF